MNKIDEYLEILDEMGGAIKFPNRQVLNETKTLSGKLFASDADGKSSGVQHIAGDDLRGFIKTAKMIAPKIQKTIDRLNKKDGDYFMDYAGDEFKEVYAALSPKYDFGSNKIVCINSKTMRDSN